MNSEAAGTEWIRKAFEEAAHEIFGDAGEFLETRTVMGGLVEYVRGDVNASWIFFKAGYESGAEVIARNVQPSPDRISIEVFQSDWRPGFAALLDDGSLAEGAPAHVILNIGSLLSAVESKDLDSRDLPYLIAETLMHEVIHCLESWAKVEFSEDRVEELLTKYREKYARAMIWEYTGAPPHEAENPQEARPVPQPATEPDGEKK